MTEREEPPRTDRGAKELERRTELIRLFKETIDTAVENINPGPGQYQGDVSIGSGFIDDGYSMRYLRPNAWHDDETFVISHSNGLGRIRLVSVFAPEEDKDRKPGIRRESKLLEDEADYGEIGSRSLSTSEMENLVKVMTSPPLNALLIEELVEPTGEERVKIETELSWKKKEADDLVRAIEEGIRRENEMTGIESETYAPEEYKDKTTASTRVLRSDPVGGP